MAVLALLMLLGVAVVGVIVEQIETHRERSHMSDAERERHRRLMRELRRHR